MSEGDGDAPKLAVLGWLALHPATHATPAATGPIHASRRMAVMVVARLPVGQPPGLPVHGEVVVGGHAGRVEPGSPGCTPDGPGCCLPPASLGVI
jgi:hypothetical protein